MEDDRGLLKKGNQWGWPPSQRCPIRGDGGGGRKGDPSCAGGKGIKV